MAGLKDVAREAGVSIGTVDRIIHKRGRYSPDTARKVKQAMDQLGYKPNFHGRGLKNQSSGGSFAALIPKPEQDSAYWSLILEGIHKAGSLLASYGCRVEVLHYDRYRTGDFRVKLNQLQAGSHKGLLIAAVDQEEAAPLLNSLKVPFGLIDTDIAECREKRISFLGEDSRQSGQLAARMLSLLLKDKPCPRIWIVQPPGGDHLGQRVKGFHSYLEEHDLSPDIHVIGESSDSEEDFHRTMDRALKEQGTLPNGIFVANALVYLGASWLQNKGVSPEQTALVGYDLIPGKEEYIEKGIIDFILTQKPREQGFLGMKLLYQKVILKEQVPGDWTAPISIVTKENLQSFTDHSVYSGWEGSL